MRNLILLTFTIFALNVNANIICHLQFLRTKDINVKKVQRAYRLAKVAHRGVTRKYEQIPYIHHPNRVAESILEHTQNENIIIAAILHDVVEDSNFTLRHINKIFGDDVARLVSEVTSDKAAIARLGKTAYLTHKLNTISDDALLIKLADRRDNLRDFPLAPEKFIIKYKTSTQEMLDGLNRPLTPAHQKIIADIKDILAQY